MPLQQTEMADSLRNVANLLKQQVDLDPKKLRIVEEFLSKFSPAEIAPNSKESSSTLPPEVLENIRQFLPPSDLKSAVLVNKKWSEVGGKPKLWSWSKVNLLHFPHLATCF